MTHPFCTCIAQIYFAYLGDLEPPNNAELRSTKTPISWCPNVLKSAGFTWQMMAWICQSLE